MYDVTFKDAVKLTGKTKRTIQRYIGSGRLTFVTDDSGLKLFNRNELLKAVGVVTHVTNDTTPINVTPIDNSQQLALANESNSIAKQQLEASNKTNALLGELISLLKDQEHKPVDPEPIEEPPIADKAIKSGTVKSDYMYGLTFVTKK
jgi:hypothetical protein